MNKALITLGAAAALSGAVLLAPQSAYADNSSNMNGQTKCHMKFSLHGWSAIYKTASGKGMVNCSNGQRMPVTISVKGGGLTAGKTTVKNGRATFNHVSDIKKVLGSYAMADAHAGAVKSSQAAVLTNGPVSMALTGTGNGWNLGVDISSFTISAARRGKH